MTKADIAERIAETINTTRKDGQDTTDLVFELMKKVLEREGKLKIAGFGVFEVKEKHARRGRNPQTGEEMTITPRRILTFKASQLWKQSLNS
ncbi:MAG: integration host factor subunit alpha [Betaproteobacteria bacterium]